MLRNQAWFKLHFFAADGAGNLAYVILQEIKWLDVHSGGVFNHIIRKTLRGGNRKNGMFVVKKCEDCVICPVIGLQLYVSVCK